MRVARREPGYVSSDPHLPRWAELAMIGAALAVIPAVVLDSTVENDAWATAGEVLNWTIWLAFAAKLVYLLARTPGGPSGSGGTFSRLRSSSSRRPFFRMPHSAAFPTGG
jgi:hypothetical protein